MARPTDRPTLPQRPNIDAVVDQIGDTGDEDFDDLAAGRADPDFLAQQIDYDLDSRVWMGTRAEDRVMRAASLVGRSLYDEVEKSLYQQESYDEFEARMLKRMGVGEPEETIGNAALRALDLTLDNEVRLAWNEGTLAAAGPEAMVPVWRAVLDDATTPKCWDNHGQLIDDLDGDLPPVHPRCRCSIVNIPDPNSDDPEWAKLGQDILDEMADERDQGDATDSDIEESEAPSRLFAEFNRRLREAGDFDPEKHPREPAGDEHGGEFASGGGGASKTNTPEFKKWFGNSKVVDSDGKPQVVYHGTPSRGSESNNQYVRSEQGDVNFPPITAFDTNAQGITDSQWLGRGTYFTPDADFAHEFGDILMPVYLSIKNPFVVPDDNSNSWEAYYAFKQAVKDIPGMPPELAINTTLPETTWQVEDYRTGAKITGYYGIEQGKNVDGKDVWMVLSKYSDHPGGGTVEAEGRTRDEAVDRFNTGKRTGDAHQRHNPDGFLLHTITRTIGSDKFRDLLQAAGYDGVTDKDGSEWVAFHPEQIKSVWNKGTFDPASAKISEAQ